MAKTIKIKRFQIGVNVLIQVATIIVIVALANWFGYRHFKRWDFSRSNKYSLSEQTKKVLQSLKADTKFIVFFAPDPSLPGAGIHGDVENLVKEYQYASDGKVSVEYVDPFRDFSRAKELGAKYNFGVENVVVIDYQDRSKVVNAAEMAEYDNSGMMYGRPPQLKAFTGEQAITSALLEVTEEKQNVVHFLQGQGQPDIAASEAFSFLKAYLERQNLKIETLNLLEASEIPATAQVLICIGPQYDFSEREIGMLQKFWDGQGRMIFLVDPTVYSPKLDAFLKGAGIERNDDRVLTTVTLSPGLTGIVRDAVATFIPGSPITKKIGGVTTRFMGGTQSLSLQREGQALQTAPLVQAAEGFWGETDYNAGDNGGVFFDAKVDHAPPLALAAASEKGGVSDERVQVQTARMIVVGNSAFIQNETLSEANLDFFLNGVNWMLDREKLIGIAPKTPDAFTLNLEESRITRIFTLVMIVMPAAVAVVGLLVWFRRRR